MRSSRIDDTSVGAGLSAIRKVVVEKNAEVARMFFERVYKNKEISQLD